MKARYVSWMGGILILILTISGCRTSAPVQKENPEEKILAEKEKLESPKEEQKILTEEESNKANQAQEKLQNAIDNQEKISQQKESLIQHLLKTAESKIAQYEYNAAKDLLDQALQLDPAHTKAIQLRNLVGTFLGEQTAKTTTIHEMYVNEVKVKVEQAKLEARNHHKQGLEAFEKKDYERAIREFEAALEIIKWAPYQLGMDSLRKEAESKIKEAKDSRDKWAAIQKETRMKEAQKKAELLEAQQQAQRANQIRILLARATEFYTRKKYDKAESMVEQVFKIDPANKVARRLLEDIKDAGHSHLSAKTLERRIEEWKLFLEEMRNSTIPMSDLIQYPDKDYWHNTINKRKSKSELGAEKKQSDQEESSAIRTIKTKLQTLPITLNFNETPFQDVIRYIQTMAEMNIVVDPKIIQKFEIEGTKVNLQVTDLKLQDALNILLQFHDLVYLFKDDVLFITSKKSDLARGKALPFLHDIRDLTGQIKDFPGPKIKLLPSKTDDSGGAKFEETPGGAQAVLTGEKLTELIKASVEPESWDKEQYSIAETSGQLLVVHTEDVQEQIRTLLNDMRRFSGMMVAIEARFLEVTDDFLEHVGVDWRGIGDNNLSTNDPNITTDDKRAVMPALGDTSKNNAASGTTVFDNEGKGIAPAAGMFFRQSVKDRTNITGQDTQRANFDMLARTEHVDDTGFGGKRLKKTGGLAVQLATLDDTQLSAVMWFIKKTGRAQTLMAPRLTAFNTQRANLTVVEQTAYIKDFDVQVAQSAYIADPVVGTIQSGIVMDVRPIVSNDKKYITLELRPTIASLESLDDFETSLGSSRKVRFQVPILRLQSVETTVRIPDQGTLLLGGLKSATNIDQKLDIPVLGNIPVLSFFFSQRSKLDEKEEILILIKAKIIDLEEEEENAVGTRK